MDRTTLLLKPHEIGQRFAQFFHIGIPPSLKAFGAPLFVAVCYYIGAQAAFWVGTLSDRMVAPFWPPNIILFCALLVVPKRDWWRFIALAFPAHIAAEITVAMPAFQVLVAFVTNCTLALLSAFWVRRFIPKPPWFGTLQRTAIYVLVSTAICPAIAALGGAFVQIMGGGPFSNYWTYWGSWGISNALGSVTIGPVFLTWLAPQHAEYSNKPSSRRTTEAAALTAGLILVCAIAFHVGRGAATTGFLPALLYSPLPLILWAAIRFGERGASGAILVVTVVAICESLRAPNLFIGSDTVTSVLALQIFLLGISIPILFLGTTIDELRRTGEATRRLAGALLRAQDEERRRIARELHDSTGQQVAMAHLMTDKVKNTVPPSCASAMGDIKEVLQGVMHEIRTVSYLLHPPLLDVGGLQLALRSYVEGFSKRTGINVDLQVSSDLGTISGDIELVLFRVVQEALTNVWRHSGSRTARIELQRQTMAGQPQLLLSIEDAGKGIPPDIRLAALSPGKSQSGAPSGLGLIGMRERLHQIGGQLEIESMTGRTIIGAIVKEEL